MYVYGVIYKQSQKNKKKIFFTQCVPEQNKL